MAWSIWVVPPSLPPLFRLDKYALQDRDSARSNGARLTVCSKRGGGGGEKEGERKGKEGGREGGKEGRGGREEEGRRKGEGERQKRIK